MERVWQKNPKSQLNKLCIKIDPQFSQNVVKPDRLCHDSPHFRILRKTETVCRRVCFNLSGFLEQETWPEPRSWGLRTCPPRRPRSAGRRARARARWRSWALPGLSTRGSARYHLWGADRRSRIFKGFVFHHICAFLTIDRRLKLLVRVSAELHLHKRAGDAAARLGKVSSSDNLRKRKISHPSPWWNLWPLRWINGLIKTYPNIHHVHDSVLLL